MGNELFEWTGMLLRWAHALAAMSWVGAAFYLARRGQTRPLQWEAYAAWASGFALLSLIFYRQAELYLIDTAVAALSKPAAIGVGIGSLIIGLAVYEGLCRTSLARSERLLGAAVLTWLAAVAWGLTQLFGERGAFIHYGAILGTIMAGNVAHVIAPVERRAAQALKEGRHADAMEAGRARQRFLHNNAFVLPVVFAMLASHFALAFVQRHAWLVLVAVTAAGLLAGAQAGSRRTQPD